MPLSYYKGLKLSIVASDDFSKSLEDLVAVHHKSNDTNLARGDRLIRMLGDAGRLRSPDQFRQETVGFWAIKAGKIRFYGWYEPNATFVLSHVIFKAKDKLAQADIDRMNKNQSHFRKVNRKP